jgi:hypothetical protein
LFLRASPAYPRLDGLMYISFWAKEVLRERICWLSFGQLLGEGTVGGDPRSKSQTQRPYPGFVRPHLLSEENIYMFVTIRMNNARYHLTLNLYSTTAPVFVSEQKVILSMRLKPTSCSEYPGIQNILG